jgi:hemerythrin
MGKVMRWDPTLEVGIEIIDNQHKILLDLANDLDNAVTAGESMKVIDTLFAVIKNYTFNHFETEEEFFKGKDVYLLHCHQHYKLIKQLNDYIIDFHNNRVGDIDPGAFFDSWLRGHIKEEDIPALSQQPFDLTLVTEVDDVDDFDSGEIEKRSHKRLRYDSVLDEDIVGHCFNATKLKNGSVNVIDLSSGGLKIYSEDSYDVDDLLIISCKIGRNFQMKEKVRVKNAHENLYGVEFLSPAADTVTFFTELCGAVNYY